MASLSILNPVGGAGGLAKSKCSKFEFIAKMGVRNLSHDGAVKRGKNAAKITQTNACIYLKIIPRLVVKS